MVDIPGLLARLRQLVPLQQAIIVGLIFFIAYGLFEYLVLGLKPGDAAEMSLYSAAIFAAVYYFTSVIIMKKSTQAEAKAKGPKKGLRRR